jgi:hypothetical protein
MTTLEQRVCQSLDGRQADRACAEPVQEAGTCHRPFEIVTAPRRPKPQHIAPPRVVAQDENFDLFEQPLCSIIHLACDEGADIEGLGPAGHCNSIGTSACGSSAAMRSLTARKGVNP